MNQLISKPVETVRNFNLKSGQFLDIYIVSMFAICVLINIEARPFIVQSAIYSHFAIFSLIVFSHGLSIQKESKILSVRVTAIAVAIITTSCLPLGFTTEPRETADTLALVFTLIAVSSFYFGAILKLTILSFSEKPILSITPMRTILFILSIPVTYMLMTYIQEYSIEAFNVGFHLLTGRTLLN